MTKQNCAVCPHVQKCWALKTNTGNPISTRNVVINLLICRLQLDINRNQAAANLISLYRPGLIKLIMQAKQNNSNVGMEIGHLLNDMQSTMIEYLLNDYKIGDRGRATPYLFDPQQGFLTKWIKWITSKQRRFYSHHELYSPLENASSEEYDNMDDMFSGETINNGGWSALVDGQQHHGVTTDPYSDLSNTAMGIIDDGVTLNSNEYRVIKFCLSNGNESNASRHIDGLHIYLARLMGVSRPRITRLYKRALDKLKRKYTSILEAENTIYEPKEQST